MSHNNVHDTDSDEEQEEDARTLKLGKGARFLPTMLPSPRCSGRARQPAPAARATQAVSSAQRLQQRGDALPEIT